MEPITVQTASPAKPDVASSEEFLRIARDMSLNAPAYSPATRIRSSRKTRIN